MYVDLHIHTSASDGTWNNKQLIDKLKEKNITMFSITDHDELDNSIKMIDYVKQFSELIYINGVETTCSYKSKEYHLTVYNFDYNNCELNNLLEYNRNLRESFDEKIIESINDLRLDVNEYKIYTYSPSIGGFKLVNYLKEKGFVNSTKEYFEWYNKIIKENIASKTFKEPTKVIEICKATGGKVFLAHPSYFYRESFTPIEELDEWKDYGIDGIECYSQYSKPEYFQYYVDYCNKYNLLISGGSDCHGEFTPGRELGFPRVTENMIKIEK